MIIYYGNMSIVQATGFFQVKSVHATNHYLNIVVEEFAFKDKLQPESQILD